MAEVKLTIDGYPITADENKTVLEAALDNGIYIPHLCYHEDLHPNGGCRLCVVKQEGVDGVITSCSTNQLVKGVCGTQQMYHHTYFPAARAAGILSTVF